MANGTNRFYTVNLVSRDDSGASGNTSVIAVENTSVEELVQCAVPFLSLASGQSIMLFHQGKVVDDKLLKDLLDVSEADNNDVTLVYDTVQETQPLDDSDIAAPRDKRTKRKEARSAKPPATDPAFGLAQDAPQDDGPPVVDTAFMLEKQMEQMRQKLMQEMRYMLANAQQPQQTQAKCTFQGANPGADARADARAAASSSTLANAQQAKRTFQGANPGADARAAASSSTLVAVPEKEKGKMPQLTSAYNALVTAGNNTPELIGAVLVRNCVGGGIDDAVKILKSILAVTKDPATLSGAAEELFGAFKFAAKPVDIIAVLQPTLKQNMFASPEETAAFFKRMLVAAFQ